MSWIVEYIWLGFMITAVPGAVFFETVRRQLHDKSSLPSFLVGNFAGVALIATLALIGMTLVTDIIRQDVFYLLSGGLLIYIGVSSAFSRPQVANKKLRRGQSFITGLVLSLANPVSVVFWVTMVGSFYERSNGYIMPIVSSLAIIFGAVLFFVLLIGLLVRFGNFLRPTLTDWLGRIFGIVIALYGLTYLLRYFG